MQNIRSNSKGPERGREKFAKAFLENSTPMSITTFREGKFVDLSDAFLELLGFERHELIGQTTTGIGFITAAQRGMLLNELKEHGRVANMEIPVKIKGGESGYALVNSSAIDIDGEDYLLTVFTNITKRKKMEAALRASERRYRTVYENTTLGIFETTPEGKAVHANRTFAVMFGFDSPEEACRELTDLAGQIYVNPGQRTEIINKVLGSHVPQRFEIEYRRRDGSTFPAILEIQAVWSEENSGYHLFGFVEDISQRQQAEERQRIAEELYRTLAEKSFAGVYVVQNGRFMFINTNAAQYAGYEREDLLGRASRDMIHPEDRERARQCAVEMVKGKRDAPYEFRIVTRQGGIRWIMETLTSINYLGEAAILGNSMDVTEYKSIATERENIINQLQRALLEVKKLSGLLPICSSCKKIRNDEGYWEQLEVYIRDRTDAQFSHGICPECVKKLYSEFLEDGR